jgi:AcrR family transcriptional regulator
MSRHPDPDLEERILRAADVLWKRGGEKSLTMRAVARAARTNTPAVYRRFKNRRDLLRGLLGRIVVRLRKVFEGAETVEAIGEAYVEYALRAPREYELFYTHGVELSPPKGAGRPRPIRESRPNFALLEQRLAQQLGGAPEDHTQTALELWALAHGTAMLLISKSIPEGHEGKLRNAYSAALKALIEAASQSSSRSASGS